MTLSQLIAKLQAIETANPGFNGNLPVFYRHGSSGDCGSLSSPRVTEEVDDCGPFDLDGGQYVSIYAGN